jgi:saxitoxin biosynthesis operon SxtJ-like protein
MKSPLPDKKQLRKFGLLVGGVFVLVGVWPTIARSDSARLWGLAVATCLIVPGLVRPQTLGPAYRAWMAVGNVLNWINTRIILGVLFYGLITPMGLARRFLGRDPMRRAFDPAVDTYRVKPNPRPGNHMTRQF